MAAQFLKFGDPPPTMGGEFERTVMQCLCDGLPDIFLVIGNLSIATYGSFFYECDVIIATVGFCEIVEVKDILAEARVFEDCITGINGFRYDRVFSILESKAKTLRGKIGQPPISQQNNVRVTSRVVLPNNTKIDFEYPDHKRNHKVVAINELIEQYSRLSFPTGDSAFQADLRRLRNGWIAYQARASLGMGTERKLGRFLIKKVLKADQTGREYLAVDEPPCKMEVHLREFKYNPLLGRAELEKYLAIVSREMQTRRRMRHQYIACVTGHFQTGMSLVQVSDWFDGRSIEESWTVVKTLSLDDKLALMIKITQALAFCHQKSVFHRNIHSGNVLVSDDCNEIRLRGFEFAKDLDLTGTVTETEMQQRDHRIIPPEEVMHKEASNSRLYDVYQAGLLFYRLMENGEWAFGDVMEFCTGDGAIRAMVNHEGDRGVKEARDLIRDMVNLEPARRPDPMNRVEGILRAIVAERTRPDSW